METTTKPQIFRIYAHDWLNSGPLKLDDGSARLNVVVVFQMLCPACVQLALPQAMKARNLFSEKRVRVIGLHSVFENHEAMTDKSLGIFLRENRIDFPVAVDDCAGSLGPPLTMTKYEFLGTPTLVIAGDDGRLLHQSFGLMSDMQLGSLIQSHIPS